MQTVTVNLDHRSYDIIIGDGLLYQAVDYIGGLLPNNRVFIITDSNVAKYHLETLEEALDSAKINHTTIILPPGEGTKSFASYEKLLNSLLSHRPERRDTLIALGGGVIGDIAGFAAATLLRGVNFIQIPTTLLAMVDSSVGGKTGINTAYGKNLVGSFYQPQLVLADTGLLNSLPGREILAGYAEVVKYGLIGNAGFFAFLEQGKPEEYDPEFAQNAIKTSCQMKAQIVSEDEREGGKRALLNLGHTFGHALEAETGYSDKLLHGEAVAIGMALAFRFSERMGICPAGDTERVIAHLTKVGLPVSPLDIKGIDFTAGKLVEHMLQDKKVQKGRLVFILVEGIGKAFIKKNVAQDDVLAFLRDVLSSYK